MKYLDWNIDKDVWLKKYRKISFNEVALALIDGDLLDTIDNPSKNFPDQQVFVINVNNYVYYVPFVENEEKFFLKTIIPSRKANKKYLKNYKL